MAATKVIAHWHKLIDGLSTTSLGFYETVEESLHRRKIPGLKHSRVVWSEGGALSPKREYLRVAGDRHVFDLCAAPFGSGFFFSSWLTKQQARWLLLYIIGFSSLIDGAARFISWVLTTAFVKMVGGSDDPLILYQYNLLRNHWLFLPLTLLMLMWIVALAARLGNGGPERAMLRVPVLGWFYGRVFAPETYYRIDTMLMFQSAVHSAMLEAIDGLTASKGLRCLSEDERKPVFHQLT